MNRLPLIIQREYLSTVGKKSFIWMTVLIPIVFIALCGVLPLLLSQAKSEEKKNVAVVDPSGLYASIIENDDEYVFLPTQLQDDQSVYDYYETSPIPLYAVVVIPDSVAATRTVNVYSTQALKNGLSRQLSRALEPALRREKIESYHIDSLESIISSCDVELTVTNVKWSEDGEESLSSTAIAQGIGIGLSMLTYMFVLIYGSMIMNGVIEEKTNRIVEVIVSSCKPMELMLGKIIGVALVGLTQIAIWAVLVGIAGVAIGVNVLATTPDAAEVMQGMESVQQASSGSVSNLLLMLSGINYAEIFICFLLYFVGGYLLYASLFAAFGSAVDQPNDASQFMMPIMLIMIFAEYAGIYCIENPDGPLAYWCSIIPLTSPIVMMIRLPFDVPFWQLLLSIVLLYGSAFGLIYVAGRIYRTGILMYGKKPSIKEMAKWLKR